MDKVIWIFGPSSVGKKTLISKSAYERTEIHDVVKIKDSIILPVILFRKGHNDSEIINIRRNVFISIYNMLNLKSLTSYSIIPVIHGQYIDIRYNILLDVLNLFKSSIDSICLYIDIDKEEFEKRKREPNLNYDSIFKNEEDNKKYLKDVFGHINYITGKI